MTECPFKLCIAQWKVLGINAEITALAVGFLCCRRAEGHITFSSFLCVEVVSSISPINDTSGRFCTLNVGMHLSCIFDEPDGALLRQYFVFKPS